MAGSQLQTPLQVQSHAAFTLRSIVYSNLKRHLAAKDAPELLVFTLKNLEEDLLHLSRPREQKPEREGMNPRLQKELLQALQMLKPMLFYLKKNQRFPPLLSRSLSKRLQPTTFTALIVVVISCLASIGPNLFFQHVWHPRIHPVAPIRRMISSSSSSSSTQICVPNKRHRKKLNWRKGIGPGSPLMEFACDPESQMGITREKYDVPDIRLSKEVGDPTDPEVQAQLDYQTWACPMAPNLWGAIPCTAGLAKT